MTETPNPSFQIDPDSTGWITFDDPDRPLNVLDEGVMMRLGQCIDEARGAAREGRMDVLVIRSGKPGSFIAGADVKEIESMEDPAEAEAKIRLGQSIYSDLAGLPVPTIAAIHGVCMGGGVEMSLACDHRLLSDSPKTKLALPEVLLGILPAWGGTSRLPQLVGLQASLDMMLTGKRIDSRKAKRIGLADDVVPADLFAEKTKTFAREVAGGRNKARPKRSLANRFLDGTGPGRAIVLRTARKRVMGQTGGHYPAPLKILDVLSSHMTKPVDARLAAEARAGAELVVSPVSKNLVHVFHMREAARKGKALSAHAREVGKVGVLGAGVMGGGVGQLAAYNDIDVYLKDIDHGAVTGGLQHARGLFDKAVKRRKLSKREAAQKMERISGGLDEHGLAGSDVVVEAIVEKLDIKRTVLRETEKHVPAECIIATNTSSLSVDDMAEALSRPDRFCGMHFFNPVHRMPLVEVVEGAQSSIEAVATINQLALRMGKIPVVVKDGPGFLVNRILGPYLNEAGHLLGDGASVAAIDKVAKEFGMPMGPCRLIDEVGIDVSGHAGAALHEALGDRLAPSAALLALGETERLGKKGGLGFYKYEKGRDTGIDDGIYAALGPAVPPRREIPDQQIRDRLVVAMINEAARLLDEGIAASAPDVDLAMIMGTGFPPFRGGLLRFADTLHMRGLLETIRALESAHGPRFAPAPLIERLAGEDRSFYDAFPAPAA